MLLGTGSQIEGFPRPIQEVLSHSRQAGIDAYARVLAFMTLRTIKRCTTGKIQRVGLSRGSNSYQSS